MCGSPTKEYGSEPVGAAFPPSTHSVPNLDVACVRQGTRNWNVEVGVMECLALILSAVNLATMRQVCTRDMHAYGQMLMHAL